jgi:Uri superfamily endonuclease
MQDEPGVYQLHLSLSDTTEITIGKLGTFRFPAGCYVYTGSALSGLERRLARHRRREKTHHWHIDYFLCHARIVEVRRQVTTERRECLLNAETLALPGACVVAARFGSSDCRCRSHLVYLGEEG